jgi:putative transposase
MEYCAHARYVWNLALEQFNFWLPGRRYPGWIEQGRQLTEARREFAWLAAVPTAVHGCALRDFDKALKRWRDGSSGRPTWRKRGAHEGFGIHEGHGGARTKRLNKKWAAVWIPKIGWVKFRQSREMPAARSFRVTRDAVGRWHVAFVVQPSPIVGPGDGSIVGVDRGVAVTLAYSDGAMVTAPKPASVRQAAQALARCKLGSNGRVRAKRRLARSHARNRDRRKDFIEKASTDLARNYDLIRIENLEIRKMTKSARGSAVAPGRNVRQKAGLNRSILEGGWFEFACRLQDKAPGRVEKVNRAYTSQRCSVCQHVDAKSRKSQALFACTACGHTSNADLNAARNIAAGHAVRGGETLSPLKRRPQHVASPAA